MARAETLQCVVSELVAGLKQVHNNDAQRQLVHAKLVEVCGEESAAKIIKGMSWRADTGWKQMLYLIKYGYLGFEPETDTTAVAKLTGAPIEAISRALVSL